MLSVDQIRPIRNQVLVRPDPQKTISDGGIHIPDTVNRDNPNYYQMTGTVIACGPGAHDGEQFHPINVKPGDRVVFGRYAGKQLELVEMWDFKQETFPTDHGLWREYRGDFVVPCWPSNNPPKNWLDETHRCSMPRKMTFLMLRESDIIAESTGSEHVQHGYQAPKASGIINRKGNEAA